MLLVQLPDGSTREYSNPQTPFSVASDIGPGLAKACVAAEVDGKVVGLDYKLPAAGQVKLKLFKKTDPEALGVMRHSCAHIMARAVMRLFDGVQLAFGPTIEGGFYYDFGLKHSLTEEDFPAIEKEMAKIIAADEPFERIEQPREKALAVCRDMGQELKVEHIEDPNGLSDQESLSFYQQGEFLDLCRGPHVPRAGVIGKAFKLLSVAGAYWKKDTTRPQLQRVYATAFFDKAELEAHLNKIEEAKKRDHRVLGKQLNLFTINPMVGSGLILWMPKGAALRHQLESFIHEELLRRNYQQVYTPNIGRIELYQTSGHYPYYSDSQFPPMGEKPFIPEISTMLAMVASEHDPDHRSNMIIYARKHLDSVWKGFTKSAFIESVLEADDEQFIKLLREYVQESQRYLLKPMNCPHHIMIYKTLPRSYRDLPVRLAEFGTVYRYEQSGELNGMTRVRGFTQDDAHIFCTEDQVAEEFRNCIEMTQMVLRSLGMDQYRVRLGFRDPNSSKYVGSPEAWDRAEGAIREVCEGLNLPALSIEQGEAAFYGPKADFVVTDCIGREWQLGTVQLDYNLPSAERFGLEYTGADNKANRPVMIHRAPLGSLERFVGVLIEHFAGAFPLWLAPEQVRVLTVSEKSEDYGRQVEAQLKAAGLRVVGDYRAEKLGAKIRDAQLELIPYMLVVGPKDAEAGTVSVRDRIDGDVGAMPVAEAIAKLQEEVSTKRVRQKVVATDAGLGNRGVTNEY